MQIFIFLHFGGDRVRREIHRCKSPIGALDLIFISSLFSLSEHTKSFETFLQKQVDGKLQKQYTFLKQSNLTAHKFSYHSSVKQPEGSAMPINCSRHAIKIPYVLNSQYAAHIKSDFISAKSKHQNTNIILAITNESISVKAVMTSW